MLAGGLTMTECLAPACLVQPGCCTVPARWEEVVVVVVVVGIVVLPTPSLLYTLASGHTGYLLTDMEKSQAA